MSENDWPLWAALWLSAAAAVICQGAWDSWVRLEALTAGRPPDLARIGIAAVISSLSAYLRNGGGLVAAFEEQAGRHFATPAVSFNRAREMLDARRLLSESQAQVNLIAYSLNISCQLSLILGCQASRCLDAVGSAYRRISALAQAKAAAFSTPKATVKLLSALPALTLALGSAFGAHPLSFLLHVGAGGLCLLVGGSCYLLGLAWMRALLTSMDEKVEM